MKQISRLRNAAQRLPGGLPLLLGVMAMSGATAWVTGMSMD